ncbi:MAG: M3 family metallopeptidase, partial [Bryobacteraceae bacterium]
LEDARRRLREIGAQPGPRTWTNTLAALDALTAPLDCALEIVRHLESVCTYPELREAYNKVQPLASAFYASIPLDEPLWRALQAYATTEEARELQGVRRRFLQKTLDNFRRQGAALPPEGKARLEQIEVELAELTTRFAQNVLDSTNAFELVIVEESRLAGLPPSAIAAARQSAEQKGITGWRFTLQQPSYTALMTYLDDASLRRQAYLAYHSRAAAEPWDNRPLLARILELRRRKAALLGYPDFAALVLEERMARSPARVREFLDGLRRRTEPGFRGEAAELEAFRRELEGPGAPPLEAWDIAWYAEKLRAARYGFEEEDLRPYFPLEQVVDGMFRLAGRLFSIRIEPCDNAPVWDPHVRSYTIRDSDGSLLGAFYTDWFPRENKRGGAWMSALVTGGPAPGGFQPHVGVICGNVTPPLDGRPALLTHREVETLFHEFGHLLHHCLSRVEIRNLAGTNVAWDFVELPSQIMENWCWEREALDLFARHWETGAPLPEDLFARMRRARTFRAATAQMRQLGFAWLDLMLHTEYDPARDGDPVSYGRRILQEFSPAPLPESHALVASFTHLFAEPVGYGAGYYSYKWAEVLDADAFTRFRREGIFNPETGRSFRCWILERGDSEDPAELYRGFMGRDPDPTALLERLGLIEKDNGGISN